VQLANEPKGLCDDKKPRGELGARLTHDLLSHRAVNEEKEQVKGNEHNRWKHMEGVLREEKDKTEDDARKD
jgi:hypothetical protein